MVQPETLVVGAVRSELERLGCIVVKMHGNQYMPEGFPDLMVVRPDGVVAFVEVKVPGRTNGPQRNGGSVLQCRWLWRLAERGTPAGWATSPAEAVGVVWRGWLGERCCSDA